MIGSLPMYDWPELREATDRWFSAIAEAAGYDLRLLRGGDHTAAWSAPDLILSQTCGYPFTHGFKGRLQLVGTPHYAAEGCEGPLYSSFVFARRKGPPAAFRGAVAAVNAPDSMSGMLALKAAFYGVAQDGLFFGQAIKTGGHLASLAALREGRAEVCAIDAVCVSLIRKHRPADLHGLFEIARTPLVPGLPYVTVAGDVMRLRQAMARVVADPALAATRERLLIDGFSVTSIADYDAIPALEQRIAAAGGLQLQLPGGTV